MLTHENVKILSRKLVTTGFLKIFKIELTHSLFAGGESSMVRRELMDRGQAVAVVLFDELRKKVVLVEQFRIGALEDPLSPWLLEFPAGVVKEGEKDEKVALRECEEEIGRKPTTLHKITNCYLSPGGCSERITIFYGLIDSNGLDNTIKGLECEHEDIRVRVIDVDEAVKMTQDGRIRNASTTLGLFWLANRLGLTSDPLL
jgi:ADP-ribose pyrophosphatase